jgi:SAM-dependent methyltransferase
MYHRRSIDDKEANMTIDDQAQVRAHVRETYAAAAANVAGGDAIPEGNALAELAYGGSYGTDLSGAVMASLGCGNPTELIELEPGQRVVDLGSGGGLDVLMAARRVGPSGRVLGVDMTPEMLALAEANRAKAGLDNVEFRLGHIEDLPVDDASADVVVSNCVVSLSADKARVLAEAWRVLAPGGQLAITDLAALRPLPSAVAASLQAWAACLAGATLLDAWPPLVIGAGFTDVDVQVAHAYGLADLGLLQDTPLGQSLLSAITESDLAAADGQIASVHITATKPA